MRLKKNYTFNNGRQIWRLLPADVNKLIIEERDLEKKQAYFNCIQLDSGKKIFRGLQLDEKFWIGIESVYKEIIYFHKFVKPDMPQHRGIIAYSITGKKLLWENPDQIFQIINDDKLYCYYEFFEGRKYLSLDYKTGKVLDENIPGDEVKFFRDELQFQNEYADYFYPKEYKPGEERDDLVKKHINDLKQKFVIIGKIDYLIKNRTLMYNFHEEKPDGFLRNLFRVVDLSTGNYILEEKLNKDTRSIVPESFFVKDNFLFLLIEKTKLSVYSIII